MRKGTGVFKKIEETILVCDKCGEEIDILKHIVYDSRWSDGYDSYGSDWDFCSLNCMVQYIGMDEMASSFYFPSGEDVEIILPSSDMKLIISKLL